MKILKYILFILLIQPFLFCNLLSQTFSLNGHFCDDKDKPIDFITVSILNKGSILTNQTITESDGIFYINNILEGSYQLIATYFNEQVYSTNLQVDRNIDLGKIKINTTISLSEIVVESKRKILERKIDRVRFNVESSSLSYGGDALDVLKKTPNINVQNNTLSIIGKSNLSILIDGKKLNLSGDDLINYLKTITSDKIKYIEVITNPPAKYEAEGNSGLINIILKRNMINTWNNSSRIIYDQSSYAGAKVYNNWDFSNDKLSFYNSINYGNGAIKINEDMNTYTDTHHVLQSMTKKSKYNNFSIKSGSTYKINRHLIGVDYVYIKNAPSLNDKGAANYNNLANLAYDSTLYSKAKRQTKIDIHSLNLNSTIRIDTLGKELNLSFDYFKYRNDAKRNLGSDLEKNNINLNQKNTNNQNIENLSFKADFHIPLSWLTIEFGGKISQIKTKNNSLYSDLIDNVNNIFHYKENIQALYFSASKSLTQHIDTKVGLRTEFSQTEGNSTITNQINKNHYVELFPTLYFLYKITDQNSISLNYGRRIRRPPFNYLDPFRWYDGSYSYSEGNPFLKPSFSNNIELNFIHKDLYSSLYYSDQSKGFGQITIVEDEIKRKTIFENYFKYHEFGLIESYTFNKFDWLNSINSFNISYIKSKSISEITDYKISGVNSNISTDNDFYLDKNKNFILSLSYWIYFSGIVDLKKYSKMDEFDISLKVLLLNRNLQLTFTAEDLFKSNYPLYTRYTNLTKVTYKNYYDYRKFTFSLTYKFGGKMNKKIKKKNFGQEEEERRISY